MAPAVAADDRARLTYTMDEKLLFALVTGLVSWIGHGIFGFHKVERSS